MYVGLLVYFKKSFSLFTNLTLILFHFKKKKKESEFKQRNLEKLIEELNFNYKSKNENEKEEIYQVLMQANEMLEYRDKIIDAFLSEYFKKSDDAEYKYVLKDVEKVTQEIESMSEKINLSLSEEFFESS